MIASVVPLVGIWIILLFNVQYCCSYDTTPHQYHPSGKISQLEKATEIARRGNPVLGMIVKDGVIIISLSKLPLSKLIIKKSLFNLKTILFDKTCVLALTGQLADSRVIVDYATSRCVEYRSKYLTSIPIEQLSEDISKALHSQTFSSDTRPLGVCSMLAGRDDLLGWQIYICDPDGTVGAYKYVCIGGGKNADKIASDIDELETIHRCSALTIVQARAFLIGYIKSKVISQLLQPLDSMNAQWRIQVTTGSSDGVKNIQWHDEIIDVHDEDRSEV